MLLLALAGRTPSAKTPRGPGPGDLVQSLLSRREGQWFDRKSARVQARALADAMIAFANAEGGLVAIGIHDDRIEGVDAVPQSMNEWRKAAGKFSEPPVKHRFELVPCTNVAGQSDHIALIEIDPSERVHSNVRGETFLRVGDENRRLTPLEAQELMYDKGDSVFDGTPVPRAAIVDLDEAVVDAYLKRVGAGTSRQEVLEARGLLVRSGRTLRPTVAGMMALGRDPQRFLPQAFTRLVRYQGSARETGVRSTVLRDRRLDGPISSQIDGARRLLRRWLPSVVRLGAEGRFVRQTLIPGFAWQEAIVNAVIHRSYSLGGDHVRAEVFDDRVEVESPGRLPGLVRVDNIRRTRFARNPRIARVASDLGYGREFGEGVDRMFDEMERVGLPDPVYSQGPASVRVVLLGEPIARKILDLLPGGSERFVEYLTRVGRASTREAAEFLDVSVPSARKHLRLLQNAGLVEHVGTSAKDPRGFWRLRRGEG